MKTTPNKLALLAHALEDFKGTQTLELAARLARCETTAAAVLIEGRNDIPAALDPTYPGPKPYVARYWSERLRAVPASTPFVKPSDSPRVGQAFVDLGNLREALRLAALGLKDQRTRARVG